MADSQWTCWQATKSAAVETQPAASLHLIEDRDWAVGGEKDEKQVSRWGEEEERKEGWARERCMIEYEEIGRFVLYFSL